ncbi:unnamed protein product [Amoebophrya sp. A25]|nr:unnamed protein product [Amoebophrya sp. A25]|eukprot:GSA25T00020135001.1
MTLTQSSRTPYDHLRFAYPETWKNLVRIFEQNGAVTNLAGVRRPEGLSLTGPHEAPVEPPKSMFELTEEEKRTIKYKEDKEKEAVHQLRLLKASRRNPTGGWYEGLPTHHKIACLYNEKPKPVEEGFAVDHQDSKGSLAPVSK